jgi:hypothetical protein
MMKKGECIMANTPKTDYPEPGQALTAKSDSNNISRKPNLPLFIIHYSLLIPPPAAALPPRNS